MKEVVICFSRQSQKFIANNQHLLPKTEIEELIKQSLRKLFKIEHNNLDVVKLHGALQGLYRIRKGDFRIIFGFQNNTFTLVKVERIERRGNVYH